MILALGMPDFIVRCNITLIRCCIAAIVITHVFQYLSPGRVLMKMVMAIIKPFKLEAVRDAVTALGVDGMTVSEVKGYGRQKGQTEIYRGSEYDIEYVPKAKIDLVVADDQVDAVVEAVRNAALTGKIGDGKIFVLDVAQSLRIRTGETGQDAL